MDLFQSELDQEDENLNRVIHEFDRYAEHALSIIPGQRSLQKK